MSDQHTYPEGTMSWEEYYALTASQAEKEMRERIDRVLRYIHIESKLYNALSTIRADWTWIVGPGEQRETTAEILPVLYTIASCTERITFRISISKGKDTVLRCINTPTREQIGAWGPHPAMLQKVLEKNKILSADALSQLIADWYMADKSISIQEEFIDLTRQWNG